MDSRETILKRGMVVLCLTLLGPSVVLRAQRPTGEIRIEVKDPSGAAMEASGKFQNVAAGLEQSFKTDAQGLYVFTNVPYGRYRLEVSRSGFATQSAMIDVQSQT